MDRRITTGKLIMPQLAFYYGDIPTDNGMDPIIDLSGDFTPPREMEILPVSHFSFQSFGFPPDEFTLIRKRVNGKQVYVMHSHSDNRLCESGFASRS